MWATVKKKRVFNFFSSYLSSTDFDYSSVKPISSESSMKNKIKLNFNQVDTFNTSELKSIPNSSSSGILNLMKTKENIFTSPALHKNSSLINSQINPTSENVDENSRFSIYFGLIGSALFGYFAMKFKNGKNESPKVKRESSFSDTEEISNKKEEEILTRNSLKNRVTTISYAANNPIEDRYNAIQLKNLDGFIVEVLDGHGGYQVAEYASKRLHIYFDEKLKELNYQSLSEDDKIKEAINHAFNSVESDLYKSAKNQLEKGVPDYIFIGSCALFIVVHDNKLYVANCGDSKAKLYRSDGAGYTPIKLSRTLNAGARKEQLRLRSEYSDDDIFVCKRSYSKACYVKGRLQPTRSLGDLYLKHQEFTGPDFRRGVRNFVKGPYIQHLPEIKVYELNRNDRFIVLATDGLWDELTPTDVANVIRQNDSDKEKIVDNLFRSALNHAANDANMSMQEILNVEPGRKKRSLHDDITVMVVDLKNQYVNY